jgi:3-phosphoshikimate 1-carboxyvinyltransferase
MKIITVSKKNKVLKGRIRLPSSKSLSNRLLMIRMMAPEPFRIHNQSDADDTLLLEDLLQQVRNKKTSRPQMEIDTANAGTVMRFLTTYLSMIPGKWILTGSERMKQRPIGVLVDAIRSLGAEIEFLGKIGYPPLMIKGRPLKGGEIMVDPGISSQFVSALLLISPSLPGGLTIRMQGQPVSTPYIMMTLRLMKYFGIDLKRDKNRIMIRESVYTAKDFMVESDWSSASFWYEAATLADEVDLFLEGLRINSLQGDSVLADIYQNFGINSEFSKEGVRLTRVKKKLDGFYFDFTDYPDIAPAVITTCAALGLRGRFEGLKSLHIKETNRVKALENEFRKLGIVLNQDLRADQTQTIEFFNPRLKSGGDTRIDSYGDHRIAMTFAPLAMQLGSIKIENPEVVSKSYPQFWDHLSSLGFELA